MASGSKDRADSLRLGFLTAVELQDGGFVGGLLVTDRFGRPLEFQCTTPVRANRTQELLYGPTLVPFIIGELIGKALTDRISIKPNLLLSDRPEMLSLREHVDAPVLCLAGSDRTAAITAPSSSLGADSSTTGSKVTLGRVEFQTHSEFPDDTATAQQLARPIDGKADLSEPIERVAEALKETMATVGGKPKVA
ncbi:hypothetical protein GC176_27790 [bacterium]|nr:hypothetical protein [bacterium]